MTKAKLESMRRNAIDIIYRIHDIGVMQSVESILEIYAKSLGFGVLQDTGTMVNTQMLANEAIAITPQEGLAMHTTITEVAEASIIPQPTIVSSSVEQHGSTERQVTIVTKPTTMIEAEEHHATVETTGEQQQPPADKEEADEQPPVQIANQVALDFQNITEQDDVPTAAELHRDIFSASSQETPRDLLSQSSSVLRETLRKRQARHMRKMQRQLFGSRTSSILGSTASTTYNKSNNIILF